jgi:DNA-directed RNA polymerase specialized sigma24 family protein
MTDSTFEQFVHEVDPQLRRALSAHMSPEHVADAIAEAFAYAWQHWGRVGALESPVGYLYRVAQSKSRTRKEGFLVWGSDHRIPDIEPGLVPALLELSPAQLRAVWLVHACGWSQVETGAALGMSASTVATHVGRALDRLRARLGVADNA